MHFDQGAVQRNGLDLDADDLLALQVFEKSAQNPRLAPAVHARIDGVPVAKSPR